MILVRKGFFIAKAGVQTVDFGLAELMQGSYAARIQLEGPHGNFRVVYLPSFSDEQILDMTEVLITESNIQFAIANQRANPMHRQETD